MARQTSNAAGVWREVSRSMLQWRTLAARSVSAFRASVLEASCRDLSLEHLGTPDVRPLTYYL